MPSLLFYCLACGVASILECRPDHAQRAGPGRTPLIASSPVPLHESAVVLIPAALGTIGGLYSFFHGFSILQQQRPLPIGLPAKSTAHHSSPPAEVGKGVELSQDEPRHEIIQLSPDGAQTSSVLMTQQGKIAAALLKAGIPNPATWTDDSSHSGVRVADPPQASLPTLKAKVSVVKETGASGVVGPATQSQASLSAIKRKAMILIWGGPALTLACVYFLAAHLGWL